MAGVVEIGFSLSHEFDGSKLKHSLKKTTIKEWLGDSVGSNVIQLTSGDGGYEDITIGGTTYSDAKIISSDSSYEGDQHFKTTVIEQKIKPDGEEECEFLGIKISKIESYSDVTRTSKRGKTVSETRSLSISLADMDELETVPPSQSGSELLDMAVSAMNDELENSQGDPCTSDGEFNRSENIDHVQCSASISQTKTTKEDCEGEELSCEKSLTKTVSKDGDGRVSVSVSGQISGIKEDKECNDAGEETGATKSKYDYALECFQEIDIEAELDEAHSSSGFADSGCPDDDAGYEFKITSKSETHCEDAGTISWSVNGADVKNPEQSNHDPDEGGAALDDETTSKSGCITTLTRQYNSSVNSEEGFNGVDFSPPDGMFGPISVSYNESSEQSSTTVVFSDDPKYDVEPDGVFKSVDETRTVCEERTSKKRYEVSCGNNIFQKIREAPGSTRVCKDVQAFACASNDEIAQALTITEGDASVVLEETFSVNISKNGKSGNACIKYHSAADLNECE